MVAMPCAHVPHAFQCRLYKDWEFTADVGNEVRQIAPANTCDFQVYVAYTLAYVLEKYFGGSHVSTYYFSYQNDSIPLNMKTRRCQRPRFAY